MGQRKYILLVLLFALLMGARGAWAIVAPEPCGHDYDCDYGKCCNSSCPPGTSGKCCGGCSTHPQPIPTVARNPTPVPINPGTVNPTVPAGQSTPTPVPTGQAIYVSPCTINCSGRTCGFTDDGAEHCTDKGLLCETGCYCVPDDWGCGTNRHVTADITSASLVDPGLDYTSANAYAINVAYTLDYGGHCGNNWILKVLKLKKVNPDGSELAGSPHINIPLNSEKGTHSSQTSTAATWSYDSWGGNLSTTTYGMGADGAYGSDPNNMKLCLKMYYQIKCSKEQDQYGNLNPDLYYWTLTDDSQVVCITKQYRCRINSLDLTAVTLSQPQNTCGSPADYTLAWTDSHADMANYISALYHDGTGWKPLASWLAAADPHTATAQLPYKAGGYNFAVCCVSGGGATDCRQTGADYCCPTPAAPQGLAPNGTYAAGAAPNAFSWSAVSKPAGTDQLSYYFNIADRAGSWTDAATPATNSYTSSALTAGHAYDWSVAAVNECGIGHTAAASLNPPPCPVPPAVTQSGPAACTSQAGSFTITDKGTGCYPHDGKVDICANVNPAGGACAYAGGSGAWSSSVFSAANTSWKFSVPDSKTLDSGTYWWRGGSRNGDYYQAASANNMYEQFEVDRLAPAAAPGLTASVSDCTNEPAAALSWNAVSDRGCLGNISYWLQVSSTSPAKDAAGGIAANVQNGWISGTDYTLPAPKCGQTYYAQIKAADTDPSPHPFHPNQTGWSDIVTFTVSCKPTCTIDPNPVSSVTSFGTATLTNTGGYADGAAGNFSYGWWTDDACGAVAPIDQKSTVFTARLDSGTCHVSGGIFASAGSKICNNFCSSAVPINCTVINPPVLTAPAETCVRTMPTSYRWNASTTAGVSNYRLQIQPAQDWCKNTDWLGNTTSYTLSACDNPITRTQAVDWRVMAAKGNCQSAWSEKRFDLDMTPPQPDPPPKPVCTLAAGGDRCTIECNWALAGAENSAVDPSCNHTYQYYLSSELGGDVTYESNNNTGAGTSLTQTLPAGESTTLKYKARDGLLNEGSFSQPVSLSCGISADPPVAVSPAGTCSNYSATSGNTVFTVDGASAGNEFQFAVYAGSGCSGAPAKTSGWITKTGSSNVTYSYSLSSGDYSWKARSRFSVAEGDTANWSDCRDFGVDKTPPGEPVFNPVVPVCVDPASHTVEFKFVSADTYCGAVGTNKNKAQGYNIQAYSSAGWYINGWFNPQNKTVNGAGLADPVLNCPASSYDAPCLRLRFNRGEATANFNIKKVQDSVPNQKYTTAAITYDIAKNCSLPAPAGKCGQYDPTSKTTPVTWTWSSGADKFQSYDEDGGGIWWARLQTSSPYTVYSVNNVPTGSPQATPGVVPGRVVRARVGYDWNTFSQEGQVNCPPPTPTPMAGGPVVNAKCDVSGQSITLDWSDSQNAAFSEFWLQVNPQSNDTPTERAPYDQTDDYLDGSLINAGKTNTGWTGDNKMTITITPDLKYDYILVGRRSDGAVSAWNTPYPQIPNTFTCHASSRGLYNSHAFLDAGNSGYGSTGCQANDGAWCAGFDAGTSANWMAREPGLCGVRAIMLGTGSSGRASKIDQGLWDLADRTSCADDSTDPDCPSGAGQYPVDCYTYDGSSYQKWVDCQAARSQIGNSNYRGGLGEISLNLKLPAFGTSWKTCLTINPADHPQYFADDRVTFVGGRVDYCSDLQYRLDQPIEIRPRQVRYTCSWGVSGSYNLPPQAYVSEYPRYTDFPDFIGTANASSTQHWPGFFQMSWGFYTGDPNPYPFKLKVETGRRYATTTEAADNTRDIGIIKSQSIDDAPFGFAVELTPTPTNTPTPTPTQAPWVKLKDCSFQSTGSLANDIPLQPLTYDSGVADDPYFINGRAGVVAAQSISLVNSNPQAQASENNWQISSGYSPLYSYSQANFISYIKSRKEYRKITSLQEIDADGIYMIDSSVAIDEADSSSRLPDHNFVLLATGGGVSINSNIKAPDFTKSAAIIAGSITIAPDVTEIDAILIADAIDTGADAPPNTGLKVVGNLVAGTLTQTRHQEGGTVKNQKPAVYIVADAEKYLDLLPYLSVDLYDWRQLR